MDTDEDHKASSPAAGGVNGVGLLPETEAYAYLLTVMYLVDHKAYQEVHTPSRTHIHISHSYREWEVDQPTFHAFAHQNLNALSMPSSLRQKICCRHRLL